MVLYSFAINYLNDLWKTTEDEAGKQLYEFLFLY